MVRAIGLRLLIVLALGAALGWFVSETSYQVLKTEVTRDPAVVELVIPAGTAAKVSGGQAVQSLPANMTFVQGDVLVVKNEDSSSHQLGPIWVPAGSSASLALKEANSYSYDCTFEPNKTFDLEVQPRLDTGTRLQGITFVGLPTAAMLFVYSLVLFPFKDSKKTIEASTSAGDSTGPQDSSHG